MAPLCKDNTTPPSAGRASTNNWDTVFALNFLNANKAIKNQKSSPPAFDGTKPGGGFSGPAIKVDGKFGDWQLSGGSGSIAELGLPVSGTATAESTPPQSIQFNGTAVIQVSLDYLPQPGQDGSSKFSGGKSNALKVKTTTPDPNTQPIVSIISLTLNKEASDAHDAISDVLEQWLIANLGSFNHTFAAIDLGAVADQGQFQWLVPTHVGYGINNPENAPVDNYVFAVMAMTANRQGVNLGHEVSPNVIPQGCNAGFLISQERFMTKIMLPGIEKMFKNASDKDFQVTGDGSTISNVNAITFQNFETSNKDGSETVEITGATLDPEKFSLIADVTTLKLNFTDLHLPWKGGRYTVHMLYDSECELYMDANKHFQACVVGTPSLSVAVTESSAEKWTNIIVGIVEGIGFAVAGAAIGGALGPAAEVTGEGIEGEATGAAEAVEGTTDTLEFSSDLVSDTDIVNLDDVNAEDDADASDDIENTEEESYSSKFKGFLRRNWRKILGMAIGGAVGAVTAKLPDILEAYSEQDLAKMPTLDEFADYSVSPIAWPGQTGYTLVSIALNESLQMGLNVNIAD
ncbi:TULIP family P47-like protein [Paraburkholderia youngii]|uniref:TULIP family P47-like protein n=1 Tax=Paraburkholderia youngii TaxID=2782701 RepID=A0A7Y6K8F9_9BURK|nr:TULIP family P47-like protein [Paraburkholderia youngii]NUY05804.1 TULIP family P47-like protein [Paraburkholderia youngii]